MPRFQINIFRKTMNDILHTTQEKKVSQYTNLIIKNLRQTLISDLMKYLKKPRQLTEIQYNYTRDHQWGLVNSNNNIDIFPTFSFKHL